ncbi:MAG: Na+/H+ antiporter NhaA, partial [Shewanella sp.]
GLVLGKPVGVLLFSFVAVKLKLAQLPDGIGWKQIAPVGVMCGIGFTMSMFIASLAFEVADPMFGDLARLGTLIGSILAALIGYFWLAAVLPKKGEQ